MHELSLAEGMLDIASQELAKHGCTRLKLLRVEVGALSGVVPEALEFGFSSLVRDTPNADAVLEIVRVPLKLRCLMCGEVFESRARPGELSACPKCGEDIGHEVLQGKEMRVVWLEGD